jgi:hypothetical protein
VDARVSELSELVKQSREEQAIISSKIFALKSGGLAKTLSADAASTLGVAGMPGSEDEMRAMRQRLEGTDRLLVDRDAELEKLRNLVHRQNAEPVMGATWKARYEEAAKKMKAGHIDFERFKGETDMKRRNVINLQSYSKILESTKRVCHEQNLRLHAQVEASRREAEVAQVDRDEFKQQMRMLQEGFSRCKNRITESVASGIASVKFGNQEPTMHFVTLRCQAPYNATMQIFEGPDAHQDVAAINLSVAGKANVVADAVDFSIVMTAAEEGNKLTLCAASKEEYLKWVGALKVVGFPNLPVR